MSKLEKTYEKIDKKQGSLGSKSYQELDFGEFLAGSGEIIVDDQVNVRKVAEMTNKMRMRKDDQVKIPKIYYEKNKLEMQ